jgi:hypothetical protein
VLTNFSVILTWNRTVTDGPGFGFNPAVTVADLNLRLYTASGFSLGAVLDSSVSTIQNVEHIVTTELGPGRYALEVTSGTVGTDYALAWGGVLQAEISTEANPLAWGSVHPAAGAYPVGELLSVEAIPAPYYVFEEWSGDLAGTDNPVSVVVGSNMNITAIFVEQYTSNHPTPYWWLAQYGYISDQETVITNLGANGYPLWQSYVAGLVPTNPLSVIKMLTPHHVPPGVLLSWNSETGVDYWVEVAFGSATPGLFGVLQTNIAGQPGRTTFRHNPAGRAGAAFYRVGTAATNLGSPITMEVPAFVPPEITIEWSSVAGVPYQIERTPHPAAPFTLLRSNILGQAGTTRYTDTNISAGGPFFYRVAVPD